MKTRREFLIGILGLGAIRPKPKYRYKIASAFKPVRNYGTIPVLHYRFARGFPPMVGID